MKITRVMAAVILIVAFLLRLSWDGAIFFYDEIEYLFEGQKAVAEIHAAARVLGGEQGVSVAYDGWTWSIVARPLHFLYAGLLGERGVHVATALCGAATCVMIFLLARRWGLAAAVIAAVLTAFSAAHVFFSRTLMPDVPGILLLLAAIHIRTTASSSKSLFVAGVLAASAFMFQSRLGLLLPVIIIGELAMDRTLKSGLWIFIGASAATVSVELWLWSLRAILDGAGVPNAVSTWTELVRAEFRAGGSGAFAVNMPFFSLRYAALSESFFVAALFLLSAILLFRKPLDRPLLFWWLFAAWALFVSTAFEQTLIPSQRYGRAVLAALPIMSLCAGVTLVRIATVPKIGRAVAAVVLAGALVWRMPLLFEILTQRADHAKALALVAQRTRTATILSDHFVHVVYYLGRDSQPAEFPPTRRATSVVVFDHDLGSSLIQTLARAPDFTLDGFYRESPFVGLEIGRSSLDRWPWRARNGPVMVWVVKPKSDLRTVAAEVSASPQPFR